MGPLKLSDKLLRENLIDFVGSDIHNINHIEEISRKIKIKNIEKLKISINANINTFG